ncbi:MAG: L-2-amino-thiazoline-4-carboxylic acid hydrolase [Armatimonadota bacterium]|nr:L-2-amino-thiazoline-4-carboxylic acid hydrolase [Armatimonadota bacterium]MDR7448592.1 L-2-amino-thiazoline-4-carboxylic acid hydrolase [Armatimonadota bacterium]MDR7459426.1 L-2-amino-thiazoline-4-carboxylic acid hydrolase [Armatimonadota bacterium]MDR7478527.1 L-2-amino-thiazoline-4-carboxylic acid hydrolase [Armatimonadota bacterium]MDR7487698.1 L-2-amino-thiazoline-4-carboxylic acid hydrolase [Armatimonadota bacterium]
METPRRPHRVQKAVCRRAVAAALGEEAAAAILRETGIAALPEDLPAGPRDLAALRRELQPFVDLYRAVLARSDRETALRVARDAIVGSGLRSHAEAAAAQRRAMASTPAGADWWTDAAPGPPLNLTSPPPPGFRAPQDVLARQFDRAMEHFSCRGELLTYTPEVVRFRITACNWVRAMQEAGTPELIPFFCETDERFMDDHPTHRLERPTAIGLGDDHCDFRFVPRKGRSADGEG